MAEIAPPRLQMREGKMQRDKTMTAPEDEKAKALEDLKGVEWCEASCDGYIGAGYDEDASSKWLGKHIETVKKCLAPAPVAGDLAKLVEIAKDQISENYVDADGKEQPGLSVVSKTVVRNLIQAATSQQALTEEELYNIGYAAIEGHQAMLLGDCVTAIIKALAARNVIKLKGE
jgi:hypothetical protein